MPCDQSSASGRSFSLASLMIPQEISISLNRKKECTPASDALTSTRSVGQSIWLNLERPPPLQFSQIGPQAHQSTVTTTTVEGPMDGTSVSNLQKFEDTQLNDVFLPFLQICRIFLLGAGLIGIATGIAPHDAETMPSHMRQACIVAASTCLVSWVYYTRLYQLRRLPMSLGYSLEGNTIAETMRYTNWTVCVALLTWVAFLLRGPFPSTRTHCELPSEWHSVTNYSQTGKSDIVQLSDYGYAPLGTRVCWSYTTWCKVGPIVTAASTAFGLPGWAAARRAREHMAEESSQRLIWANFFFGSICLTIAVVGSVLVALPMVEPYDSRERDSREYELAQYISLLWFVYPIVSCIRTIALGIGVTQAKVQQELGVSIKRVQGAQTLGTVDGLKSTSTWALTALAGIGVTVASVLQVGASILRSTYLAIVTAPRPRSAVALARISAAVNFGGPFSEIEKSAEEKIPLLAMSDLRIDPVQPAHISVKGRMPMAEYTPNDARRMRVHMPEVSPLCAQIFDSTIAIVDIGSQALVALGCAALVIPPVESI